MTSLTTESLILARTRAFHDHYSFPFPSELRERNGDVFHIVEVEPDVFSEFRLGISPYSRILEPFPRIANTPKDEPSLFTPALVQAMPQLLAFWVALAEDLGFEFVKMQKAPLYSDLMDHDDISTLFNQAGFRGLSLGELSFLSEHGIELKRTATFLKTCKGYHLPKLFDVKQQMKQIFTWSKQEEPLFSYKQFPESTWKATNYSYQGYKGQLILSREDGEFYLVEPTLSYKEEIAVISNKENPLEHLFPLIEKKVRVNNLFTPSIEFTKQRLSPYPEETVREVFGVLAEQSTAQDIERYFASCTDDVDFFRVNLPGDCDLIQALGHYFILHLPTKRLLHACRTQGEVEVHAARLLHEHLNRWK